MGDVPAIRTARLELVSYSPAMMSAVVAGDRPAAEQLLGASLVGSLDEELRGFFEIRLADLAADPSIQPWLARAIVRVTESGERRVIGSVGFHGPPGNDLRAEIGYQIEPTSRRNGFALEAVRGMLDWAAIEHGVGRFRASIAPTNAPSLALVARLGFVEVGRRIDEVDGEELVLERDHWVVEPRS